jgi:hypothetical protein
MGNRRKAYSLETKGGEKVSKTNMGNRGKAHTR